MSPLLTCYNGGPNTHRWFREEKNEVQPTELRRRWKHAGLAAMGAIGLALAITGWLLAPAGAARAARSAPSNHGRTGLLVARVLTSQQTVPPPKDCQPNPIGPPTHPYQLGFLAEVGPLPGQPSQLVAGPVRVDNITAKACGVATVIPGSGGCAVNASINVPPDGQLFGNIKAAITIIPGVTPEIPFTPAAKSLTSGLGCGSSVNGLQVSATATVGGSATLFGLTCGLTLTIPLKATINGPLDSTGLGLHGVFQPSKPFVIPTATPSATCPAGVTKNLNQIVGLPLTVGTGALNLPFSAGVYLPKS